MSSMTEHINFKTVASNIFVDWLLDHDITQGYIVHLDGTIKVSHDKLHTFAKMITDSPDYDEHEAIFFNICSKTKSLFVAAIHRTTRGNAQGGTRMQFYPTAFDIFTDAIRLSKGMTRKNAIAKLWWGGGKSIIHPYPGQQLMNATDSEFRHAALVNFGKFIASLKGLYLCAKDMNTTLEDMRIIHANNRFCTCIPEEIGGSSDPSEYTAKGVYFGILAALHSLDSLAPNPNHQNLQGKHVLLEGIGHVGFHVLELLIEAGAEVTLYDKFINRIRNKIDERFSKAERNRIHIVHSPEELYTTPADLFSPNAIGATVNEQTIKQFKVKAIAGGANNQLLDPVKDAERLHAKEILYVPDFYINRMGIINCANEQYGYLPADIEEKLDDIYPDVVELLNTAKASDTSPQFKALEEAKKRATVPHPIWPNKGNKIIRYLLKQ